MASDAKVLVTGATGTHGGIGSYLIDALVARGMAVRALVRGHDCRSAALHQRGAEIAVGDFLKLETLRPAFEGVDSVFFCYPLADGLLQATTNVCVAAKDATVRSITNVSIMLAAPDQPSPVCRDHWLSERILDWAGVGAIHLRGAFFFENLLRFALPAIQCEGRIVLPFGDGSAKLAWVGAFDMAAVAAATLTRPKAHVGRTYEITGESTLSINQVAEIMSASLGRPIEYAATPLRKWLDIVEPVLGNNRQLRSHVTMLGHAFSSGRVKGRTNNLVEELTGNAPQRLASFLARHAQLFAPSI